MNVGHTVTKEIRKPKCEVLPDTRKRLTRYFQLQAGWSYKDAIFEAWGAADTGPITSETTGFTGLRLVQQSVDDVGRVREDAPQPMAILVKVYEQIPATAEVQVGGNTTVRLPDGRIETEANFLQFASATYTPGTINVTTAPGDATSYLDREEAANDGTLRRITRHYIQAGTTQTSTRTNNKGKLLIYTETKVRTAPSTPSGYTLIDQKVDNPNGVPIYTYTFAKGLGRVSTSTDLRYNGKWSQTTIRYLDTDDEATPSGTLIASAEDKNDGHTVYTRTYGVVVGDGYISSSTETRNDGKLVIYRSTRLGSAPVAPSPTIGGTVVLIASTVRQESGVDIYESTWAEGYGRIDISTDVRNGGKLTITTVRYLEVDDGTPPSGTLITTQESKDTGYSLFTKVYADGSGRISTRTDTRYNGRLVVETITYLDADDGSTPAGVLIASETRAENGYTVYTKSYERTVADYIVSNTEEVKNSGSLYVYRTVKLDSPPATPAGHGGTVSLIETRVSQQNGHAEYAYTWVEGEGVISKSTSPRDGGLRIETWVSYGPAFNAGTMVPDGIQLTQDQEYIDGTYRFTVSCMQRYDGESPISGTALQFGIYHPFTYPGRAKPIATTVVTRTTYDVYLSPPIETMVEAVVTVTYTTNPLVTGLLNPYWAPTEWATLIASYWAWNAYPKSRIEGLRGYRAVTETPITWTPAAGDTTCMGDRVYGGVGPYSIQVVGGPEAPDGNTYTLMAKTEEAFKSYAGVKYYRQTVVTATIPAQEALPV